MTPANGRILTINGGSSSIKFAIFEGSSPFLRTLHGGIERIGVQGTTLTVKGPRPEDNFSQSAFANDHAMAATTLIDCIVGRLGDDQLAAIGHRVVHGGPDYSKPRRVDPSMIKRLRALSAFDPQHLPEEILLIEAFQHHFPDLPQIACFDTAFHHDLPRVAQLLPIPRSYEALGVRRYGFHGLSYTYLMQELARLEGDDVARGRIVLAHLGNGASLAAVHNRKSVDTSMSFTPTAGVPMGTRSGDLDPGLAGYLAHIENMSAEQFSDMANLRSGLLGMSGTSSDMRVLLDTEATDVHAAEAVAVFCYEIRKRIGAFAAALGGLDTLVFAGGIGENAPVIRDRVCAELAFLGIELDVERNNQTLPVISSDASRVRVRVMRTDEELVIAQAIARLLGSTVQSKGG
ncbi:MAG: acetate/propionate family kinase [Devosia sp.]